MLCAAAAGEVHAPSAKTRETNVRAEALAPGDFVSLARALG